MSLVPMTDPGRLKGFDKDAKDRDAAIKDDLGKLGKGVKAVDENAKDRDSARQEGIVGQGLAEDCSIEQDFEIPGS